MNAVSGAGSSHLLTQTTTQIRLGSSYVKGGSSGFKSRPRGCALKPKNHTVKIFKFPRLNFLVISLCSLTWAVPTLGIPYGEFGILIEDS